MHLPSLALAFASLLCLGLLDNARGPLFPELLRDLRLTDAEGGWFFAAASAAGGTASLLGRAAVARLGLLGALRLGLALSTAGIAALGLTRGLGGLVGGAAVFGLGIGLQSVAQGVLVDRGTPPPLKRRVFAGLHSMYGLASLFAPLLVAGLARAEVGWRVAFPLLAAFPLALLTLSALAPRPPAPAAPAPVGAARPQGDRGAHAWVGLVTACYCASELLISTRLVLHLRRLGWEQDEASGALSLFFLALLAGRVAFGLLPARGATGPLLAASLVASLGAWALGLWVHPMLLCLCGLTMAPFFPTAMALVSEAFPREVDAALGVVYAFVSFGIVLMHWGVGALSDAAGLDRALLVGPGALVVALALVAWAPWTRRAG